MSNYLHSADTNNHRCMGSREYVKCESCIHHCKKDGCLYCKELHFFPDIKVINFFGCYNFKEDKIDLFTWQEKGE